MNLLDESFEILCRLEDVNVRRNRAGKAVYEVANLAQNFSVLDVKSRTHLKSLITEKMGRYIIGFSSDICAIAINEDSKEMLKAAICLHMLEGFNSDARENVRELIFIDFASDLLGVTLAEVVGAVDYLADDTARYHLGLFLKRPKELNKLACFGVGYKYDGGKIKFVPL